MTTTTYPNSALAILEDFLKEPFDVLSPFFDHATSNQATRYQQVKWSEDDDNYFAQMVLPGVKKSQLNIEFDDDIVTLTVNAKPEQTETQPLFQRRFSVPKGVLVDQAEAHLEDGIFKLTLPKPPEKKPISIKVE